MRKFSFALLFALFAALIAQSPLRHTVSAALFFSETPVAVDTLAHIGRVEVEDFIAPAEAEKEGIRFEGRVGIQMERLEPLAPVELGRLDQETLWLARVIYSETKRPQEQELVAWVVRNRVETGYRGKHSYRDVVLDPMQFSAFNGEPTRSFYSGLGVRSAHPGWQRALAIAHEVKDAPAIQRPFSVETRHFYSEQSMVGRRHPVWAEGKAAVEPVREMELEARRFRFVPDVG